MRLKLSLLMLGLVSIFAAIPAHADSVYVTAWQQVFNGGSQTFWTFGPGLKGPAPVDPSAQDFAYYGYKPPFTVEDDAIGNLNTYYATYGTFSDPAATNTFSGYVNLTDKDGFVAGLPFECTDSCSNVIYMPDNGVAEFDWLNSSLDLVTNPTTPTPEPSSLMLLGIGILAAMAIFVYGPHKPKGVTGVDDFEEVLQTKS